MHFKFNFLKKTVLFFLFFVQGIFAFGFEYIKDNQYQIGEIVHIKRGWQPIDAEDLSLGFDPNVYWFKLNLETETTERVLSLENAHLDYVDFYLIDNQGKVINAVHTGDLRDFNTREILTNFFTFKIPAEQCSVYIKVQTEGALLLSAKLYSSEKYFEAANTRWGFFWLTVGITVCSFIFNLFFFLKIKDIVFIKYLLLSVAVLCYLLVNYSFHFQYFFPHLPLLNKFNIVLYLFPTFYIPVFCVSIYKTGIYIKKVALVEKIYIGMAIVTIIFAMFSNYNSVIIYGNFLGIMLLFFASIGSIFLTFLDSSKEKLFISIGVNVYLFFLLLFLFVMPGTISSNYFLDNSIEIGSSFMLMFAFVSVVYKFDLLRDEVRKYQIEVIQLLEKQTNEIKERNAVLVEMVRERTHSLEERNAEIETRNEQLHQQYNYLEEQKRLLELKNTEIEENHKIIEKYNTNLEKVIEERTNNLLKTNELLESKNHQLEHYTYITAHNLRSPIASMLGLLQLLKLDNESGVDKELVFRRLNQSTNKLNAVVRDLSVFLQSQEVLKKQFDEIDLKVILNDIQSLFEVDIEDANVTINIEFRGDSWVNSVKVYLQSIFYNLISNAIKYRRVDVSPQIDIFIDTFGEFNTFSVKDNGTGLEVVNLEDFLHKTKKTTNLGGLGLGLMIVHKQILALGGEMKIAGKKDEGTTFVFWLPK